MYLQDYDIDWYWRCINKAAHQVDFENAVEMTGIIIICAVPLYIISYFPLPCVTACGIACLMLSFIYKLMRRNKANYAYVVLMSEQTGHMYAQELFHYHGRFLLDDELRDIMRRRHRKM